MTKNKAQTSAPKSVETAKPVGKVSKEDQDTLQQLKSNVAFCRALTQKAQAEQRAAELEVQAATLRLFMKYGMSPNDQVDADGNILRVEVTPVLSNEEAK